MKNVLLILLALAIPNVAMAASNTIVDVAEQNGNFKTLTALLQEAGLVETLKGKGPFTVFAPTDEAFAKIPKETLSALKADKEKLARVLKYHVVSGDVDSKAVVKLESAMTVAGEKIEIESSDGVMVNDAKVVTPDVEASNGVIHIIDTVLMP